MTLGLWVWIIGGFFLAAGCAVAWERGVGSDCLEDRWMPGLIFLGAWGCAPAIAAVLVMAGLAAATGAAVQRLERRLPQRPSRNELEARIAGLEHELGLDREENRA